MWFQFYVNATQGKSLFSLEKPKQRHYRFLHNQTKKRFSINLLLPKRAWMISQLCTGERSASAGMKDTTTLKCSQHLRGIHSSVVRYKAGPAKPLPCWGSASSPGGVRVRQPEILCTELRMPGIPADFLGACLLCSKTIRVSKLILSKCTKGKEIY